VLFATGPSEPIARQIRLVGQTILLKVNGDFEIVQVTGWVLELRLPDDEASACGATTLPSATTISAAAVRSRVRRRVVLVSPRLRGSVFIALLLSRGYVVCSDATARRSRVDVVLIQALALVGRALASS
jgi:hypothetical protein